MPASRPVNVVLRALQILRVLNRQPVSSVDAIHKQTAIPKPTIVRLLQTLEADGLVRRAPQYGAYRLYGRCKLDYAGVSHSHKART